MTAIESTYYSKIVEHCLRLSTAGR